MGKLYGTIIKGIGGFYYVKTHDSIYECKARGVFRKDSITPCVGDSVVLSVKETGFASIDEILPRENFLLRPPVSNIDRLFIVTSTCDPTPNLLILDKMIAIAIYKRIEPILVVSKIDLKNDAGIYDIYKNSKIKVIAFSSKTMQGKEEIENTLKAGVNVFTGNSGVGKSSLLNTICPNLSLSTGITSKKLGRGKHTTRQVEFFEYKEDIFVVDTPGFSIVDIQRVEHIKKEELQDCFLEFQPYIHRCQFNSCAHICEKGCGVLESVKNGDVHKSRHNSYVSMYKELNEINEWLYR